MRKVRIKELTHESFSPYGSFANLINPNSIKIGDAPIEFYRDMVLLNLGNNNQASFSVCRVLKRDLVIDLTEYHNFSGEGTLPLDGDVLMHVGPATPEGEIPVDKIEVFRVPKGTFVSIRPGVWHHAVFAYKCDYVNTLIVLPERTYANDCKVCKLEGEDRIQIVED